MWSLRADDRVLILDVPAVKELAAIGRILLQGCAVVVGSRDEIDDGRKALADFDNIMFVQGAPDRIPWRSQFFTKILIPQQFDSLRQSLAGELQRVLAPGGAIVSLTESA
jgi:hypothetical protein